MTHYPAIARTRYRGDIIEVEPVVRRIVSIPAMADNSVGFTGNFNLLGGANIKEFSAVVPQQTLALGPVMLDFLDGPVEHPVVGNYEHLFQPGATRLTSANGQVFWDWSERGYFTVDTPGTKALIGFGEGRRFELGKVVVQSQTPLSFIYVTAAEPDRTLATADRILITTVARMQFANALLDEPTMTNLAATSEPQSTVSLLIEPVRAVVELKGRDNASVVALDHGGRNTTQPVPVEFTDDGIRVALDGAKTKAVHYLVVAE